MKEIVGLGLILRNLHGITSSAGAVLLFQTLVKDLKTSTTETKSKITESINSINYNTGYQYSVTGTNIEMDGSSITPGTNTKSNNIDGVTSSWTNLELNKKPNGQFQILEKLFNLQKHIKVQV